MRSKLLYHALLFLSFSFLAKTQFQKMVDETPEIIKDSATVTKEWEKLERLLKNLVREGTKMLMPLVMDNMQSLNISSSCIRDSIQVFAGIRKLQTWAMRFLDSSAKGIDGLATGTAFSLGVYDECVDTAVLNQRSGKHKGEVMFTGKYCVMRIKPMLPAWKASYKVNNIMDELKGIHKRGTILSEMTRYAPVFYDFPIRLGLCIPSGCSVDDVNNLFSKVSDYTGLYMKTKRCETKEQPNFTPVMIFAICLYSFAGFMVLLGTIIDAYCYCCEKKLNSASVRVILAFSLMSNFRKFVDTSTSSKTLSCLNGIRFLTLSWVILGHSYALPMYQIISGLEYVLHLIQGFAMQPVLNGIMAVETFFFLGGFLVCYVTTMHVKISHKRFSVKTYILHRLWRILPVYLFVILFVFLSELISSGPIAYTSVHPFIDACRKNWWASLLFIHNYYDTDSMCVPHGWYLSVDMQLYIGSLIVLLPLLRWPKVGISIAVVSIISSIIACAMMNYINGYPPLFLFTDPNMKLLVDAYTAFYIKPYPHVAPYMIGILVGYLLAIKPKLKIPKVVQLFGWSIAITVSLCIVYGTYDWNLGREWTLWEAVFYNSLERLGWTLCVAWMVICCATGHGGVVNYILSWKMWIPLGRLSFIAYLAHLFVMAYYTAIMATPLTPKHAIGVWMFLGNIVVTYGAAFAGSMLIESPALSLEKLLLSRRGVEMKEKSDYDAGNTLRIIDVTTVEGSTAGSLNQNCNVSESYKGAENPGFVCKL